MGTLSRQRSVVLLGCVVWVSKRSLRFAANVSLFSFSLVVSTTGYRHRQVCNVPVTIGRSVNKRWCAVTTRCASDPFALHLSQGDFYEVEYKGYNRTSATFREMVSAFRL